MAGGGEGFAVRGGQPGPEQGRGGAVGDGAGVGELVDGGGGFVEVDEHEGLFGGGVGKQCGRFRFAGGGFGAFVVAPR